MDNKLHWLDRYNQQLNYISTSLVSAGVIYLLAANWFMFPQSVQLAIPQILLLISGSLTCYFKPATIKGHCCAAFTAVMTGLSLATYGQVYQTGADSFQLFGVWSLLLIPWLYFRLSSVWVLFSITTLLTVYLANQQWLDLDSHTYQFCLSLFLLALIGLAHYFCQSARLVLMLIIATVCCFIAISDLSFFQHSDYDYIPVSWLTISFIVPLLIATLFYIQRWPAGLSISLLMLAINSSFWFISEYITVMDIGAEMVFTIAIVIFIWCGLLSKLLQFFVPGQLNWSGLPAIFGAWLCSLLSTAGFYLLFDDNVNIILILSILITGLVLLFFQTTNLFIRQLSFAMTLCGQILLFGYIVITLEYNAVTDYYLLATQVIIIVCSWWITSSQFWRTLQLIILLIIYLFIFEQTINYLLFIPFILWTIKPSLFAKNSWRRPVLVVLLTSATLFMTINSINNMDIYHITDIGQLLYFDITQIIALSLFSVGLYLARHQLNIKIFIPFIVLSLLLIACNQLAILAILIALIPISQHQDSLLSFLAMLALAICLWIFYYSLGTPLMIKGMIIISSGILIGVASYFSALKLQGAEQQ